MKLHQFNCTEGQSIDLRQANAVFRYRPDIIIFEAPSIGQTSDLTFNKYKPKNKPLDLVRKHQNMLRKLGKKMPWVLSDIYVYDNIIKLWEEGHNVKLYNVDAPSELLRGGIDTKNPIWNPKPCRRGTNFSWWVRIYLREKIMAKNIKKIFSNLPKKDPVVLIFLQKFHWRNVQFLLQNPSRNQIYKYYFGAFKNIDIDTITEKVKKEDKILYKYWKKLSDFLT